MRRGQEPTGGMAVGRRDPSMAVKMMPQTLQGPWNRDVRHLRPNLVIAVAADVEELSKAPWPGRTLRRGALAVCCAIIG